MTSATTFGPSIVDALKLVPGRTLGATPTRLTDNLTGEIVNGTVIGDPDPAYDDCSEDVTVIMCGKNIGELLNSKNITWRWFQGGFKPTGNGTDGKIKCDSEHPNIDGTMHTDYIPHHEPFQYYNFKSNSHHLFPTSISMEKWIRLITNMI